MRTLLLIAWLLMVPALIIAEELPRPQVADPFGLGERLALIDHLRETCKLTPPASATMEQLVAMYWQHHRKELETLSEDATSQALSADRIRRLHSELKERYQVDAPADAEEATLGTMLAAARAKAASEAMKQVLSKAAARDNPASPEDAARFAEQDRDAARVRIGMAEQDEKSARAELVQLDEQRRALGEQTRKLEATLEALRDRYNEAVTKHNHLVNLYDKKTLEGSTDALKTLELIHDQRKVIDEAKLTVDAQAVEIEQVAKKDEALVARRLRLDEIISGLVQRRSEEQRKVEGANVRAGGSGGAAATPGGMAGGPIAGSPQAKLVAGVVLLVVKDRGTGTGFIVSRDGLVVTNAHVLKDRKASVMAMWDAGAKRKTVMMRVIDFAEADDLVLLKADGGAPYEPLVLREEYEIQRPLISAGFPLAGSVAETLQTSPSDLVVSRGILGSVRRSSHRVEWLQHDCRVSSGNSGGPVIDQQTGAVIGVTTLVLSTDGVHSHGDGINLAIPIRKVMDRFATYLKP